MPAESFEPIRLCALADLADGDAREGREFRPFAESRETLFLIRQEDSVVGYRNICPHIGTPLNWSPDRFLDLDKQYIVCATHGARFRVEDGECISGPCLGDALEPVALEIRAGDVFLTRDP